MSSIASYSPISGLNGLPLPSITLPTSARHEPASGSGEGEQPTAEPAKVAEWHHAECGEDQGACGAGIVVMN